MVTRERPSFAFAAVSLAASVALDAAELSKRRAARRRAGERSMGRARDCMAADGSRRTGEGLAEFDIGGPGGDGTEGGWSIDGVVLVVIVSEVV